ncbi:hypothetical protein F5148DRAFT_1245168 [Russula earlei]|uniref:Uncharacterized protein n=1 Tax=Russula earlei TaxID=71964 RepID=A0ACC0TVG5_9AGAM|nr:hypothetical protein F5148DRAFT_1245168 [Russula earlei]
MPLTRATTRAATATLLIAITITTCHSPLLSPPLHLPFALLCHHCDGQFQPPGRCKVNHSWSQNHIAHLTPLWY